ncbi:MAG: hypothetical protein H6680_00815 [Desulfobacteraceae bacterium]|nr:hypothetical protein [Desulfobacteraceae bacterium]
MNPVIQEEESGCGIASVAAIVKKTYSEVKEKAASLGIYADDKKLFSDTHYVRRLLKEYNVSVSDSEIPFVSWEELPDTALLSIKYHVEDDKPFWHWVVFTRQNGHEVILDSAAYLEKNKRIDFNQMSPKWFIRVNAT